MSERLMLRAVLPGIFLSFCAAGTAGSAPVVESRRLEERHLTLAIRGLSGPRFPERVKALIDGAELPDARLSLDAPAVGIFVDNSVGCALSNMGPPLSRHIEQVIRALPPDALVTVSTFNAGGVAPVVVKTPAGKLGRLALSCVRGRSKSVGDLALALRSQHVTYDVLIAYSSGNLYLDEARSSALLGLASKQFLNSYLPRSGGEERSTEQTTYSTRTYQEAPSQWLASLLSAEVSALSLGGHVALDLPEGLKSGEYRLDLEFLSKGVSVGQASVHVPYVAPPKKVLGGRGLPPWLWVLLAVLAAEGILLVVSYYLTPRCPHCKRAVLRPQKVCLYCLKQGDALLIFEDGGEKKVIAARAATSVGSDRSFDIRLKSLPVKAGFELRRHRNIYQLTSQHQNVDVNRQPLRSSRYIQSGDVISIGGWSCQFYVKA